MNNPRVQPLESSVKVFCAKCAREVDTLTVEKDDILLRTRIIATCHGEIETFGPDAIRATHLPGMGEIYAFEGGA